MNEKKPLKLIRRDALALVAGALLIFCSCSPTSSDSESLASNNQDPKVMTSETTENERSQLDAESPESRSEKVLDGRTVYDQAGKTEHESRWADSPEPADPNLQTPRRSPTTPGTNDSSPGNPRGTTGRPLTTHN